MRRLCSIFVLCAWLLANGAHWDMAQSFAWGRMIAEYSRTMPLDEAVRLTFTPDNLCGICEFVAEGKTRADSDAAADQTSAPRDPALKSTLFLALAPDQAWGFPAPSAPTWPFVQLIARDLVRPEPPSEPPRQAA